MVAMSRSERGTHAQSHAITRTNTNTRKHIHTDTRKNIQGRSRMHKTLPTLKPPPLPPPSLPPFCRLSLPPLVPSGWGPRDAEPSSQV